MFVPVLALGREDCCSEIVDLNCSRSSVKRHYIDQETV